MDSHSRENNRFPKGFPVEEVQSSRKIIGPLADSLVGFSKDQKTMTIIQANGQFMIGRAYVEPLSCDLIENMLLQRDFIID